MVDGKTPHFQIKMQYGGCLDSIVHFDEMTKVRFCNWVRFLTECREDGQDANVVCRRDQRPLQYTACRNISTGDELIVAFTSSCGDSMKLTPSTKPTNVQTSNSTHIDLAPFLQGNNSKPSLIKFGWNGYWKEKRQSKRPYYPGS